MTRRSLTVEYDGFSRAGIDRNRIQWNDPMGDTEYSPPRQANL
jgi:hypothetical protein